MRRRKTVVSEVVRIPVQNKGAHRGEYYTRLYGRSDLTPNLVHLTKPSKGDIECIFNKYGGFNEQAYKELNLKAVDTLIKILKVGTINGSTTESGFIIGDRTAACFQELPLEAIKQNIEIEQERMKYSTKPKVRYCGVGVSFDRFYVYEQEGRPVIYEEKETAKKFLNDNKDEYWRIVNFKLERKEPYVEDLFSKTKPIKTKDLETTIIDWTHEREWRVPESFVFDLVDDFKLNNHLYLIFKDKETYDYFLEKLKVDGQEANILFEETNADEMFKDEYLNKAKRENKDIYELEEEIGDEIYKEEFYDQLALARENDSNMIDITFNSLVPNSFDYSHNYHIIILDDLESSPAK